MARGVAHLLPDAEERDGSHPSLRPRVLHLRRAGQAPRSVGAARQTVLGCGSEARVRLPPHTCWWTKDMRNIVATVIMRLKFSALA